MRVFPPSTLEKHRLPTLAVIMLALAVASAPKSASAEQPLTERAPTHVLQWGQPGEGDGEFKSPIGIAIDRQDVLYVTEFHGNRVQKFDTDGKFIGKFPVAEHPGGIAVHADGRVFVAPMLLHKIVVYGTGGEQVAEFGELGEGDGQFNQPGGLAFGPDDELYVCDQSNHRIQVFTAEGKFLRKFGGHGTEPGQFGGLGTKGSRLAGPHFLAFDAEGNLFVTEGAQGRIQKLSREGSPLLTWGKNDEGPGGFGGREKAARNALPGPIGIALDHNGNLWVSSSNSRLQCFTPNGDYVTGLLQEGSEPGQFLLPHAMVVDSKGFLYVVDSSNQRIQKLAP